MSDWVEIAKTEEIPTGHSAMVEIDGRPIAIFNCDGEFYALDDTCSHAEASLSEGELDLSRCAIECPLHGSVFDLRTGKPLSFPATEPVAVHQIATDGGILKVRISDGNDN